ncbi:MULTISPECIES: glycoside hydrolase family 3 C-terminal domain-containing protein [unclassified Paenibacillus]|uniref:glycoside hydrolase family 3 C-terminal domain-containing protein n=1 Tax=unclassified Paenibacillus TaxID=185978 RepID=UPI00095480C2|nr:MULTISPECIES: glycoside hydrolase family 3 C-terminal domain-containing protein [unclassified Paenibacillus]ASS67147.1 carbohydrate-binding protein [Paenibacillus sp. RUD330]SIQ88353.1 beta-glucosidase [Paenibacillus sp. RU4X]SIR09361.1 beta-glucosidase [Paenibacillus sp. RU4T]
MSTGTYAYPFLNPGLPLKERAKSLVALLTLEEKISLMSQYQAEIPRLGIAKYKHGTEGAHGIAWLGEATVFPQPIGLAATWNDELMKEIGKAISEEARVYYGRDPERNGLTIWAPTVDMERDPRWGRTEEAYGEDPYLTGKLTASLVRGMQGDDPFYLRAAATLKHFYANNNEKERGFFSASIDPRNKREYYLKAFEPAFREGGAVSMMTAYNSVNGIPCNLLEDVNGIVRDEWGMDGFVVSDAGDVLGTVNDHGFLASYAEAVAQSIRSGIDSITDDSETVHRAVRDALDRGLLDEGDLDRALVHTFSVRIRLGEWDAENPYADVPESRLCAPEHAALARRAARESVVLLRNEAPDGAPEFPRSGSRGVTPLLPLPADGSIAVIGPLADEAFVDWYSGTPPYRVTPLAGIRERLGSAGEADFQTGSDIVRLRSLSSGRYVGQARALTADAENSESAETFERTDWGCGNLTLRALSSGLLVTEGEEGLEAAAAEARGWFVKEVFSLKEEEEGGLLLTWNGTPVGMAAEGRLMPVSQDGPENFDAADAANPGAAEEAARAERMRRRQKPSKPERFAIEIVSRGLETAAAAAAAASAAVIVVGNQPFIGGKEDADRTGLALAESQQALIRAVAAANPRTAVVLVSSYPFALEGTEEAVPSLLQVCHAGQELGSAVAGALFGDYSPAGRLPMTWYRSEEGLPPLFDYDVIRQGRTYQYWPGEVLYPFGHGLSYSEFRYGGLTVDREAVAAGETALVSLEVANTGKMAADEVVQLYVRVEGSRVKRPLRKLAGFKRVALQPGETATVPFALDSRELEVWDVTRGRFALERGRCMLMAGASSADIRCMAELDIAGEEIPPRSLNLWTPAVHYDDCGSIRIDACTEGGDSAAPAGGSGWLLFRDCLLPEGEAVFEARVAGAGAGMIELRLDGPEGPLVGRCPVPRTGGPQAWTHLEEKVTLPASPEGMERRTLALLPSGDVRLSRFRLG